MNIFSDLKHRFEMMDSDDRKRLGAIGGILMLAVVIGGGSFWWLDSRWQSPPSIFDAPVDDALGYLALDDFNGLSLEERMSYLTDFAQRFRGMQQEESASAAAFLAGLTGPTREQMRQNARILAKDILMDGAEGYLSLPEDDRAAFLDEWMTRWMRAGEQFMLGEERGMSDEERLARVNEESREDFQRRSETDRIPKVTGENVSRFIDFWQSDIEIASTPREQGQIIRFLEDLRGHLITPPGS